MLWCGFSTLLLDLIFCLIIACNSVLKRSATRFCVSIDEVAAPVIEVIMVDCVCLLKGDSGESMLCS